MSRSVSQRSAALSATIILGDGLRGTKPDDSLDGERYGYWRDERSAGINEGICRCRNLWNVNSKRCGRKGEIGDFETVTREFYLEI